MSGNRLSKADSPRLAVLQMAFRTVKQIQKNRYIVEADGLCGVLTLGQEVIMSCMYQKIISVGKYLRVFRSTRVIHPVWAAELDAGESGLFDLDGAEIVPFGRYSRASAVAVFGIALTDAINKILIVVSNNGSIRKELNGAKILAIGVKGYAAIVGKYEKSTAFSIEGRPVISILDAKMNVHKDLNFLYKNVEQVGEDSYKATKGNRYTYVNSYGLPTTANWCISEK